MTDKPLTRSVFDDDYLTPLAVHPLSEYFIGETLNETEHYFGETIDPRFLQCPFPSHPAIGSSYGSVHPADVATRPASTGWNSIHRYTPTASENGYLLPNKRQTSLRRTLNGCSSPSWMNILSSVPNHTVAKFWSTYHTVHNLSRTSPPDRRLFGAFYQYDGELNACLLCNYTIQNQTQMLQHIAGLHFNSFQYRCSAEGCPFSSARLADFKTHTREQHENSGVGHNCAMCKKTIKHKRNYVRHVKKHRNGTVEEARLSDAS